jgi:transposase
MSLSGVDFLLAVVIALEVGDVCRFPRVSHLASYAETMPRVQASSGKIKHGRTQPDVNRHLKWTFVEVANVVCCHRGVVRHLAEATYWS